MSEEVEIEEVEVEETPEVEEELFEGDKTTQVLKENFNKIREKNKETRETVNERRANDLREIAGKDPIEPEEPEEIEEVDPEVEEVEAEAEEQVEGLEFPKSWPQDKQELWATLDPSVQEMVHKREQDFHDGIEQYKNHAKYAQEVNEVFKPYQAEMNAAGVTQKELMESSLNTVYKLTKGTPEQKVQTVLEIAQQYGVDLTHLGGAVGQVQAGQPIVDPLYAQLKQKTEGLEQLLLKQQQAEAEKVKTNFANDIDNFAADKNNEFFEDVREEMADIFENGPDSLTLADAYEKAIWTNPKTREQLIARQQEEAQRKAAEKAAAAKKTAATNVAARGRPQGAATAKGSVDDVLKATMAEIQSRK